MRVSYIHNNQAWGEQTDSYSFKKLLEHRLLGQNMTTTVACSCQSNDGFCLFFFNFKRTMCNSVDKFIFSKIWGLIDVKSL